MSKKYETFVEIFAALSEGKKLRHPKWHNTDYALLREGGLVDRMGNSVSINCLEMGMEEYATIAACLCTGDNFKLVDEQGNAKELEYTVIAVYPSHILYTERNTNQGIGHYMSKTTPVVKI